MIGRQRRVPLGVVTNGLSRATGFATTYSMIVCSSSLPKEASNSFAASARSMSPQDKPESVLSAMRVSALHPASMYRIISGWNPASLSNLSASRDLLHRGLW